MVWNSGSGSAEAGIIGAAEYATSGAPASCQTCTRSSGSATNSTPSTVTGPSPPAFTP
jgi:hypothetical protein